MSTVFNCSVIGASHITGNKPCQDYSLSWESDDKKIQGIIVCDGHGSDTYVRSDVGSRLAAEIAKGCILKFVDEIINDGSLRSIKEKKGSVTARTNTNKTLKQYEEFCRQTENIKDVDALFFSLFVKIKNKWLNAIEKDSIDHPFSEDEKNHLSNNSLVKAYGSTLMAYVRTEYFWFAFHIGDGRIVGINRKFEATQLVPWDCLCFQNATTSLCESNPESSFRYAFDATGYFPSTVFCCSDGVEDCFGDYDMNCNNPSGLHNFYYKFLTEYSQKSVSTIIEALKPALSNFSEKVSKDDMSLAGIIDAEKLDLGIERFKISLQNQSMIKQHEDREKNLSDSLSMIANLESEAANLLEEKKNEEENGRSILSLIEDIKRQIEQLTQKLKNLFSDKENSDNNVKSWEERITAKNIEIEEAKKKHAELEIANKEADEKALEMRKQLKLEYDRLGNDIEKMMSQDVENWQSNLKD